MEQSLSKRDLIDTDVLIDVRRGFPDAVAWFAQYQASHTLQVSVVTSMELIQGARNGSDLSKTMDFLRQVTEVPTALSHGLQLLTHNHKHFQMIPGLTVASPY